MSISSSQLSGASQVLLRNIELLRANTPLFINLPEDGFIDLFLSENSNCQLSCYNTNYIDYQAIKNKHVANVTCTFASVYQSDIKHDLVIIAFPKSKAELTFTLAMIAQYLTENTKVILVGEKKGGIQSSPKLIENFLVNYQKIDSARHCLLYVGIFTNKNLPIDAKPFNINDWFTQYKITINDVTLTIASLPGVFSQQKLDIGTALLLQNLPESMQGKILDFGCGAGVISCFIGKKFANTELSLLDVSALALASAKKTLSLNNLSGTVFASNSLSTVKEHYQHIVSNPPFHQGIKTNYRATEQFLQQGKNHINRQGTITIVANSFLRYRPIMEEYIGRTALLIKKHGFTVYHGKIK
ncbi:MAG: methyltransferase [Colwellia sp.]